MNYKMTPAQVQSAIREKLSHIYGVSAKNASDDEFYKASALVAVSYTHLTLPTT